MPKVITTNIFIKVTNAIDLKYLTEMLFSPFFNESCKILSPTPKPPIPIERIKQYGKKVAAMTHRVVITTVILENNLATQLSFNIEKNLL